MKSTSNLLSTGPTIPVRLSQTLGPLSLSSSVGAMSVYYFHHGEEQYDEERFFCKRCGTTLYWISSNHPHLVGVAGGCLADQNRLKSTAKRR